MGRPSIVDVRIRSRIVRIHRTRRTIRVVRIVPTTDSRFSKPVFQPCSWRIQRSLSQWRTCPLHMDFVLSDPKMNLRARGLILRRGSVCEKTDLNTNSRKFTCVSSGLRESVCACSALRRVAPCCTRLQPAPATRELGQTLHWRRPHKKPDRSQP